MPNAVLVVSVNQVDRKNFGILLNRPDVRNQLVYHDKLRVNDVLVSGETRDSLSNIGMVLRFGVLLPQGADVESTFVIVDKRVLRNITPHIFSVNQDVADRIIVVSQNGKVSFLSNMTYEDVTRDYDRQVA